VSAVPVDGAALDELILPSAIQELTPLPDGSAIGPEGRLQIERTLDRRGRLNRYLASWRGDDGAPVAVELREAPADAPDLRREAEVLAEVRYAMLPAPLASFEEGGRRYLALDRREGETLAEALAAGLTPERATSIVLQLAQVLRRLHGAGWALLGLHPADVISGTPPRI
jgi:serine/threonine protein kinase